MTYPASSATHDYNRPGKLPYKPIKSEPYLPFATYRRPYPRCPFTNLGNRYTALWAPKLQSPLVKAHRQATRITLTILARGALDAKYLAPPSKTLQPGVYPEESNPSQLGISSTNHLLLKYSPLPIVPRGTLFNPNYSPTQTSRKPPFMVTLRHVSSIRCNSSWCRTRRL